MTDKDPKDMTVSEQLRWAANGEPYNGIDENIWTYPTGKIRALAEAVTGEWPSDNEIFSIVADKIDAELAEARELSLLRGAEIWAKANGWPDFREGEDFGAWLERCAIPRPRYEDGEVVQFGDGGICWHNTIKALGSDFAGWVANAVRNSGELIAVTEVDIVAVAETNADGRVKRAVCKALGADGLPIVYGETVFLVPGAYSDGLPPDCGELIVTDTRTLSPVVVPRIDPFGEHGLYRVPASSLTHTPPDTQERIDRDARKGYMTYWECVGCSCERCPAMIDGDKPWRWYHADSCEGAMVLDLLRRQRELDKRTGGTE